MGGVILRTEDRSRRVEWERRLGLEQGELDRVVFECEPSQRATVGEAQAADVWRSVAARFGLSGEERDQLERDFWAGDEVDHELVKYIQQLKRDYRSVLLSNAWPDVRPYIEEVWSFADAFHEIVISAEVGLAKPEPEIYQLVLDRLQISAPEAVFIDDFSRNVAGARAVGLHALRFHSREQVQQELEDLLSA